MTAANYSSLYRTNLLENVIPFWMKNSRDQEYGGYFTCLDTKGQVYDTDKFLWLQCRQIWCFAMLYNRVEKRQEWLDFAIHGAEFVLKHGRDKEGNFYFSLDRSGRPLVQPYNIFSDCFATMAFGQLYTATGDKQHAALARNTFDNILHRSGNTKGIYNKQFPGTRPLESFSLPMILCNLVLEIEPLLSKEVFDKTIALGIDTVMNRFYQPDLNLILEHIQPDGKRSDSFEGRLINPGHGIEAMWFIMDLAEKLNRKELIEKATAITLSTLEYSWDKKHHGIFYFLDRLGHPPQQLEWDQKLWWVHVETLISLAKGYLHTGNPDCWDWFQQVHEYTWGHFVDEKNGEWFGYLNRQGEVLLPLKGGKWKGCFHVPRGLFQLWKTMDMIKQKNWRNMAVVSSQNISVVPLTTGKQPSYNTALFSLAVLYFMMGFITCLNDSLVPFFKAGFNLNYTQSSLVQFYFFLTYGLISLPAGRIVERIGFKKGMITGFVIAAIGAFLFYPSSIFHSYALFLASLFILAMGIVILQVSANPYITVLGPQETASSRLTLIQGVGSIGTTVAPIFGAAVFLSALKHSSNSSKAVGLPYLAIGAFLVIIALALLKLRLPEIKPGSTTIEKKEDRQLTLFSFRNLNFGMVGIFVYVGAEVSLGTFLTNYISDKISVETSIASRYVAFYWGSMLVGRIIGSFVLKRVKPQRVLLILALGSVALILLSLVTEGYFSIWSMIAVGLCNSVMFAIIFSLSVKGTASFTTRASGLLSTAIVGGAIISFLQGVLKDNFSWEVAFLVPVICYLYLAFYGLNGYRSKYGK